MKYPIYFFSIIIFGQMFVSCNARSTDTSKNEVKMTEKYVEIGDSVMASRDPMKVIDPLWWNVSIYDSKAQYEKDLEPFSFHQRAVFALMWYMAEVNNGGHGQFYSNSTGIVWEDAMDGFELIGLPEGAKIIAESARRFKDKPSFDRIERETALDSMDEDFDDLDSRFYKLDSTVNVTERIADHIEKNREAFYFKGKVRAPK